jgi:chromosome segregation ATPase
MSEIEVPASLPEAMREVSKSNSREWDGQDAIDAIPGARLEAEKALAQEYLEATEEQPPEEVAEPAEEEAVEEPSEEVEELEATEENAPALAEEQTPRATQRIQKLVAEKKAAESKMEALLERLAQAELARQAAEQQRQQEVAYERQMRELEYQKQQRMRMLEEAGFDPTDPRNQYMMVVGDENQELKNKLSMIEQQIQQQRAAEAHAEGWRVYNSNLDRALKSTLAGRALDPETEEVVRKAVTAMATVNNSADPIEEVRTILKPYLKVLKPAAGTAPKAPQQAANAQAHRAVALKGTTGSQKAGQKAGSAKPSRPTLDQAREMLFGSAKTEWDR